MKNKVQFVNLEMPIGTYDTTIRVGLSNGMVFERTANHLSEFDKANRLVCLYHAFKNRLITQDYNFSH